MVEPDALLIVEACACLRALVYVECLYEFVEREELLLCAWVPAQQREEVDNGFGEVSALAIARRNVARLRIVPFEREHGEAKAVAVALREFALALGLEQQRQMGEGRHGVLPTERAVEQNVKRCAGQPLLATDYVRNLHEVVVDDVSQVVCRQLVGTLVEHLVVEDVALDDDVSADHVVDVYVDAGLHLEAYYVLLAVGDTTLHFLLRQCERVGHLAACACVVLEVLYLGTLSLKLLGRVEGDVSLVGS